MKNRISLLSFKLKLAAVLAVTGLMPALAEAHPFHGAANGFAGGLGHPLSGLDHILAMVAVGLWAAQLGGCSRWTVPAAFVSLMVVGGALGMAGVHIPAVESGIAASVLVLGVMIAVAVRLPMFAGMALVGLFAIFHGHAHGTETPAAASGFTYAAGFVLATIFLHACGIGLGMLAQKRMAIPALRFAGAVIAFAGICFWFFQAP
jgi:urease accessory protein